MNADEIGEVGESYFRQICARDSLIANKSDRDRTGWDFLVEWPAAKILDAPRDLHPTQPSCFVQVKAVLTGTKEITLRLSSAERLVKARLPAFIYVPRIDDKGLIKGESVVHIDEKFSRAVLKRLRQAHVDGDKPNKISVTFSLRKYARAIPPSSTFRSDVEAAMGRDFARYCSVKEKMLQTVGYEKGGMTFKATFKAKTEEDIVDAFLGLSAIDGSVSDARDERFDIPVPITGFPEGEGQIVFNPTPHGRAQVTFRKSHTSRALRFEGELYGVPAALAVIDVFKARIKFELFQLVIRMERSNLREGSSLTIKSFPEQFEGGKLPAVEWDKFYELMQLLDNGKALVDIKIKGVSQPLSGYSETSPITSEMKHVEWMRSLLRALTELLTRTDQLNLKFNIHEVTACKQQIETVHALLWPEQGKAKISFKSDLVSDGMPAAQKLPFIFPVVLADAIIGVVASGVFSAQEQDGDLLWEGQDLTFEYAQELGSLEGELDQLASSARDVLGAESSIVFDIENMEGDETGPGM